MYVSALFYLRLSIFIYGFLAGLKRTTKVWMVGELKGKRWVSGVGVSFVPLIAARLAATSLSSAVVNFAPN